MKQIKTIIKPYEQLYSYDEEVNKHLSEGWKLNKREIQRVSGEITEAFTVPVIFVLYAELEKEIPAFEEITL
jgi:hypothetical protein